MTWAAFILAVLRDQRHRIIDPVEEREFWARRNAAVTTRQKAGQPGSAAAQPPRAAGAPPLQVQAGPIAQSRPGPTGGNR